LSLLHIFAGALFMHYLCIIGALSVLFLWIIYALWVLCPAADPGSSNQGTGQQYKPSTTVEVEPPVRPSEQIQAGTKNSA
jgi:hypothetical protein